MPVARRALAAVAAAMLLAACQTGERPSFDTTPEGSSETDAADETDGDPETPIEVATGGTDDNASTARSGYVAMFDTSSGVTETAAYTVVQAAQQLTATATLVRDGDRTALEVRGTQFREVAGERSTCDLTTGECVPDFDEQPLSDLQLTSGFWGPDVARKLTSPAYANRIGPITTSTVTIAGQPATCVDFPGPNRTDRFCALASGILAAMDTAYVRVELTDYEPTFDESVWAEVSLP